MCSGARLARRRHPLTATPRKHIQLTASGRRDEDIARRLEAVSEFAAHEGARVAEADMDPIAPGRENLVAGEHRLSADVAGNRIAFGGRRAAFHRYVYVAAAEAIQTQFQEYAPQAVLRLEIRQ